MFTYRARCNLLIALGVPFGDDAVNPLHVDGRGLQAIELELHRVPDLGWIGDIGAVQRSLQQQQCVGSGLRRISDRPACAVAQTLTPPVCQTTLPCRAWW